MAINDYDVERLRAKINDYVGGLSVTRAEVQSTLERVEHLWDDYPLWRPTLVHLGLAQLMLQTEVAVEYMDVTDSALASVVSECGSYVGADDDEFDEEVVSAADCLMGEGRELSMHRVCDSLRGLDWGGDALAARLERLWGCGLDSRDLCRVTDEAESLMAWLEREGADTGLYSDVHRSVVAAYDALCSDDGYDEVAPRVAGILGELAEFGSALGAAYASADMTEADLRAALGLPPRRDRH